MQRAVEEKREESVSASFVVVGGNRRGAVRKKGMNWWFSGEVRKVNREGEGADNAEPKRLSDKMVAVAVVKSGPNQRRGQKKKQCTYSPRWP